MHPWAEISVQTADVTVASVLLNGIEVGVSNDPDAWTVHASVHYALDKIFMGGRFWSDRRRSDE